VVRIVIPFRSLRFPRAPTQTWGIALGRIIRRNSEEAYWPHLTKRVKGFVPQFNVVQGLPNISPGRNVQFNPYTMFARARFLDEDAADIRSAGDQRLGVDARLVLRDALTVDGTINPDFSQVETDDPQVTVTAPNRWSKRGKNWPSARQLTRSGTRGLNNARGVSGFGALAARERRGRHLDYKRSSVHFAPQFSVPLGFVKRAGSRPLEQEL